MPRLARLDAPEIFHHIIIRGIERRKIFLGIIANLGDVDSYSALYLTQVFQFFKIPICHVKPG
jgi:hypothetical protein